MSKLPSVKGSGLHMNIPLLRSLLFIPGNHSKMLNKALALEPDAYIPDMEDSVPPEEKKIARETIAHILPQLASTGRPVVPRVNSIDTGLIKQDLSCVVGPYIFGVSVGKIRSRTDVQLISSIIDDIENSNHLQNGQIRLIPWIETASAIIHASEICTASPRVVAVAFGAEDFTNDMGIPRTKDNREVAFAKNVVSVAARAAKILAIDTPYFKLNDADGLRLDSETARGQGFKGKCAIHPEQIDIINNAFSPSKLEICKAKRIVAAFNQSKLSGRGSTSLDGEVVDIPVFERAQGLLRLARSTEREASDEDYY